MTSFNQLWDRAPRWRKAVAFLMFMGLWWTDQQIMDMLLGKGWDK